LTIFSVADVDESTAWLLVLFASPPNPDGGFVELDVLSRFEVLSFLPLSAFPNPSDFSLPRFEEMDVSSDVVSIGI
jgi:hypothetical protein